MFVETLNSRGKLHGKRPSSGAARFREAPFLLSIWFSSLSGALYNSDFGGSVDDFVAINEGYHVRVEVSTYRRMIACFAVHRLPFLFSNQM